MCHLWWSRNEIKKSLKISFGMTTSSLWCNDGDQWSVRLSWVLRLPWYMVWGFERNPKVSLNCPEENFLKEVSHGDCWGLEMSQLEHLVLYEYFRVLKGVNLNVLVLYPNVQGSWNESIWWWITGVLKEVKFWWFAVQPAVMVLKWVTCTNFWFSWMSLSVKGLEMISWVSMTPLNCQLLPGMKGLERSHCAHFYWVLLLKGLERSQFVLLHCLLPWFWHCCTCGFSASALAVWWCSLWAPWWPLFCWTPWVSLLCPWGSPWAAWFSWAPWWTLFFCTPWGSLLCP